MQIFEQHLGVVEAVEGDTFMVRYWELLIPARMSDNLKEKPVKAVMCSLHGITRVNRLSQRYSKIYWKYRLQIPVCKDNQTYNTSISLES